MQQSPPPVESGCQWIAPVCTAVDWWQLVPDGLRDWLIADFPSWLAVILAVLALRAVLRNLTHVSFVEPTWEAHRAPAANPLVINDGKVHISGSVLFQPLAQGFAITSVTIRNSWWSGVQTLSSEDDLEFIPSLSPRHFIQGASLRRYSVSVPDNGRDKITIWVEITLADGSRAKFKRTLRVTELNLTIGN